MILHLGNKDIGWPIFNAALTSVRSVAASRARNALPSEEITAVLNVYWLIVSTSTHPLSHGGGGWGGVGL